MLDIKRPEDTNYLLLEAILDKKSDVKNIYIFQFKDKNEIKIVNYFFKKHKGRANESEIRITDISVSRNHAVIKLVDGFFYLNDNLSKFGTLSQVYSEVMILPDKQLALQIGRSFTLFNVNKTLLECLNCCHKYDKNLT